jgi:4-hydroxybenzoate polyprenyltransferase
MSTVITSVITSVMTSVMTGVFLAVNLVGLTGLLVCIGDVLKLGMLFYSFAVSESLLSLGSKIVKVDLTNPSNCWWWFRYGFWLAGGSISISLLSKCLL